MKRSVTRKLAAMMAAVCLMTVGSAVATGAAAESAGSAAKASLSYSTSGVKIEYQIKDGAMYMRYVMPDGTVTAWVFVKKL